MQTSQRSDVNAVAVARPDELSMPGVPGQFEHVEDRAEFRRPAHLPGLELYRAHIVHHAFEPHTHEAFGLGAIEQGVERFRYNGAEHLAPADSIVLMNPDELHTGRAETAAGWRYRMMYIDPAVVEMFMGEPGWWFQDAVCHDVPGARTVTFLLDELWRADESLAFDSALFSLLDACRRHASIPQVAKEVGAPRFALVLDYMRSNLSEKLTLADLAQIAGLSAFHFLRSFQSQYHVTPQKMLMAFRLYEAKCLLASGVPPAQVAAVTGLTDQAHLNRAFVRRYGVTPARYQQQVRR